MARMKVLGTGWAMSERLFNTSFILENDKSQYLLVDVGGGNQILSRLEDMNIKLNEIHDIFISHKHTDHVLGILWIIRKLEFDYIRKNNYQGNLTIYCHSQLEKVIRGLCELTLKQRFIDLLDNKIIFKIVSDEEHINIIDYDMEILDIKARGDLQYGFKTTLENGKTIAFMGDEPLQEALFKKVQGVDYLCHEADCLDSDADIYKPYKFNHDTVKTASQKAQSLSIKNLILWHTKEVYLNDRQKLYVKEGKQVYDGNIIVPNDLDIIEL